MGVALSMYLILGAGYSILMYYYLDWKIGEYEGGKNLEKDDIDRLEEVSEQVNFVGGKGYVILLFVICTLFWLPMLIFDPPSKS